MASPTRPGSARRSRRGGERGFTFLVLVGIITVLTIALAAALPHWKAVVQRGKEAELVARGWQYAEAIRVFQARFGRLPNQLAELVELEPRSIRRLWTDPLTGGPFLLVIEGPGGALVSVDPATGAVVAPPRASGGGLDGESLAEDGEEGEGPAAPGRSGGSAFGGEGAPIAGPIHGVRSRATGESFRTLFDAASYDQWEFTVERLVAATSATDPEGLPRRVTYDSIGKPFRYPPPGGLAGANPAVEGGKPPSGELPEGDVGEDPDEVEPDDDGGAEDDGG